MKKGYRFESPPSFSKQGGVVLFVALTFLVILTLLGISNMQVSIMEERMTGAFGDRNTVAFESAELALRDAESYLNDHALAAPFNNTKRGLHTPFDGSSNPSFWQATQNSATNPVCATSFNWLQTADVDACSSVQLAATRKAPGSLEAPRYVIEQLAKVPVPGSSLIKPEFYQVYRITARGVGGQASAVVILQSTYKLKI